MRFKKKCQAIIVESVTDGVIWKHYCDMYSGLEYDKNGDGRSNWIPHHMYIIVEDKIFENDYFYDKVSGNIYQARTPNFVEWANDKELPKIIASTTLGPKPNIPLDFILKFCASGTSPYILVQFEEFADKKPYPLLENGKIILDELKIHWSELDVIDMCKKVLVDNNDMTPAEILKTSRFREWVNENFIAKY